MTEDDARFLFHLLLRHRLHGCDYIKKKKKKKTTPSHRVLWLRCLIGARAEKEEQFVHGVEKEEEEDCCSTTIAAGRILRSALPHFDYYN